MKRFIVAICLVAFLSADASALCHGRGAERRAERRANRQGPVQATAKATVGATKAVLSAPLKVLSCVGGICR